MLVSLKEIGKYIDLSNLTPTQIAEGLTFAGVEVEDVTSLASGTNLCIGEITKCEAHPDSDHLHVLEVYLGTKYGSKHIVCGAPNARKGLKVIVAMIGAKLPGGEIKFSTIRGVDSEGMCCSLLELGVDNKYLSEAQTKGIEELPSDAPVGEENVLGYLGLDDTILNLKVLANRPDLLSIYNVSREIGAIFNRKVNIPTYELKSDFITKLTVNSITDKCEQFAGCEVMGIKVKPSPKWMQSALMAMGVRSINNIVDIGNYVMLLTGQPLHMYDADKLKKNELVAKSDYEGDFVALDEKTYQIKNGDIVICSDNKPMCLGGVMGSLECAVDNNSKHIYIESASFDGATIRRTSTRLGLASESSSRFVKGTNRYQAEEVISLVTYLLKEYADANKVSNIVNYATSSYKEQIIKTSIDKINNRLGTEFSLIEIKDTLLRLGFKVNESKNNLDIIVPKYRLDISGDADISEEVIRLLGFNHVKSNLPVLPTTVGALSLEANRKKKIRDYLCSIGLDECLTYSLVSKKEAEQFNLLNNEEKYVLLNPLTDDHEVMRTHLAHSLLRVSGYNVSRQAKSLGLFEVSNVTSKKSFSTHLCIVLTGQAYERGMLETRNYDFYDLKGIVESLFTLLGIETSRYKIETSSLKSDELHPGKSADVIFQGQLVGRFGEIHPNQYKEYDLGKNVTLVLELNLDLLLSSKVSITKMSEISRFPSISRDLALVVNKSVTSAEIVKIIKMTGKGLVSEANVFDVYEGENIANDKKSLAISITFSSLDHTLTDKEIVDSLDKIKFALLNGVNAELRS